MFVLGIQCERFGYVLTFVNEKAGLCAIQNILAASKGDPTQLVEIVDDYNSRAAIRPNEVKGYSLIDQDRQSEVLIQNKMREVRTNISLNQRINGDPQMRLAAARSPIIPQGGLA